MDYKKIKAETTATTKNTDVFDNLTGNIYESIVVLSRRSNQIQKDLKTELDQKIEEFVLTTDNLEEIFENREQIEIARYYERLPKPTLYAIHEFENDMIYYRKPEAEEIENND